MLTVLAILGVLAVLFGAAVVATREGEVLRDAPEDVADLALPRGPLQAEDVRSARLGLAFRGYRMSEVDALLDRLAEQLAQAPVEAPVETLLDAPVEAPAVQAPDEDEAEKTVAAVRAAPVSANAAEVFERPVRQPVVPSEPPLESPPVHPRATDVAVTATPIEITQPPVEVAQPAVETSQPPVEIAQTPVEIAPLPAGEPPEAPRD
ncbi:MAG: DivIVA domain-containing protein [Actinobacteria bacterium]|nr:DivIVA domain-containing protein [Actinomycetota bacterium]MCA1721811.1 DivIVA domain-containing protein [Actinomycetota bacterium]